MNAAERRRILDQLELDHSDMSDEEVIQIPEINLRTQTLDQMGMDYSDMSNAEILKIAPEKLWPKEPTALDTAWEMAKAAPQAISDGVQAAQHGLVKGLSLQYGDTTKMQSDEAAAKRIQASVERFPEVDMAGNVVGSAISGLIPAAGIAKLTQLTKAGPIARFLMNTAGGAAEGVAMKPEGGRTRVDNLMSGAAIGANASAVQELLGTGARSLGRSLTRMTDAEAKAYAANPQESERLASMARDNPEQLLSELELKIRGERVPGGRAGGVGDKIVNRVVSPARQEKMATGQGSRFTLDPKNIENTSGGEVLKQILNPTISVERPLLQRTMYDVSPQAQQGLPLSTKLEFESQMPSNDAHFVKVMNQGDLGLKSQQTTRRLIEQPRGQQELFQKGQISMAPMDRKTVAPRVEAPVSENGPTQLNSINWQTQKGLPLTQKSAITYQEPGLATEFPNAHIQEPLPFKQMVEEPKVDFPRTNANGTVELTFEELDSLMQELGTSFKKPLEVGAPASVIAQRQRDADQYMALKEMMETRFPKVMGLNDTISKALDHTRLANKKRGGLSRYLKANGSPEFEAHRKYLDQNAGTNLEEIATQYSAGKKVLPPVDGKEASLGEDVLSMPAHLSGIARTRPKKLSRVTGRTMLRNERALQRYIESAQGPQVLNAIINGQEWEE